MKSDLWLPKNVDIDLKGASKKMHHDALKLDEMNMIELKRVLSINGITYIIFLF